MKKIILCILIMILLVGCNTTKNKEKTDAQLFKEEYEKLNNQDTNYNDYKYRPLNIDENNPFIYKEPKDIIKMIDNKETFVVYFGFASCPWCRSVIPNLIEVAKNLQIKTIYYVDVKDIRNVLEVDENGNIVTKKEGKHEYNQLLEKLNPVLDDYIITDNNNNEVNTDTKRIYAPNIISILNGEPVKMTTGISDYQTDAFMELTDEIQNDSKSQIKCAIECIVEEKKVCTADKKC